MSVKLNTDNSNNTQNMLTSVEATFAELRRPRMHWPTRCETFRAVIAVVTFLVIGAGLVGLADLLLSRILDPLLSYTLYH